MAQVRQRPVPGHIVEGFEDSRPETTGQRLVALGWQINTNQYRLVHLAAEFAGGDEWRRSGATPAHWIARELDIEPSTAREWIRMGRALRHVPLIDAAFRDGNISFAKVRVLTRWADEDNEAELLAVAQERSATRLSAALAKALAAGEDDEDRDKRHHQARSFSYYTSPDGMVVGTFRLPPAIAKQIISAIETLVRLVARTPTNTACGSGAVPASAASERAHGATPTSEAAQPATAPEPAADPANVATNKPGDTPKMPLVGVPSTEDPPAVASQVAVQEVPGDEDPPAVASQVAVQEVPGTEDPPAVASGTIVGGGVDGGPADWISQLTALRRSWTPGHDGADDEWAFPSMAQQRADALVVLFTSTGVQLTTEVVIHVRGDGNTFDDGTPLTDNSVVNMLPTSLVRAMIHDAERRPIDASGKQRYPTQRQHRVVMERHRHECVDCATTDILELDHNPAFEETRRTTIEELEPRCAPCHRARHRQDMRQQRAA